MSVPATIRYKAFLSYSHKDVIWGKWLHRALETYRIDRDLVGRMTAVGRIPSNLRPIFVDRDDFASGYSLNEATSYAIENSEFLIVICSPHAASSFYVNEEIRLFKAAGKSTQIVPIIVDGQPNDPELECFPPALKFEVGGDGQITRKGSEPIAADAREIADGREVAKLKVVAGLLGVGLDDIRKRAARAARRRATILLSTAFIMGLLAIAAASEAWVAHLRAVEAEQRLDWALQTAGSITSKASIYKDRFGVPVPVLTDMLREVETLLDRLSQQGVNNPKLTVREAALLNALSDGYVSIGNTTKALEHAQRAAEKLESVAIADGRPPQDEDSRAWSHMKIGDIFRQQSKSNEAIDEYLTAKKILDLLVGAQPQNLQWQASVASALNRIGSLSVTKGNLQKAKDAFNEEISIRRRLQAAYPADNFYKEMLALSLVDRANTSMFSNELNQAQPIYLEALTINTELIKYDPSNATWAQHLAYTQQNLGDCSYRQGHLAEAIEYYKLADLARKKLSSLDPTNVVKLEDLAGITASIAYAYSITGQTKAAENAFAETVATRQKIIALDPSNGSEKGRLSLSLAQLAMARYDLGNLTSALSDIENALHLGAELIEADPNNSTIKAARVIHLGVMSNIQDSLGDKTGSIASVEEMVALSAESAKADPTNGLKKYELFASRQFLANKYREQAKFKDAQELLISLKSEAEEVKNSNEAADVVWLNLLSSYYNRLYLSYFDMENYVEAMNAAVECLEVTRKWNQLDDRSDAAKKQLGLANTIVGIATRLLKRFQQSHSALQASLEIRQKLVESDPNNNQNKADLAVSWSQLNALYWDEQNFSEALLAEENALTLRKELVRSDIKNLNFQISIAESYFDVASALVQLGRKTEARQAFENSLKFRRVIAQLHPDRTDNATEIEKTSNRLFSLGLIDENSP